ncbi:MAG: PDZ domain-containing protein [Bacteroidota bacterium]
MKNIIFIALLCFLFQTTWSQKHTESKVTIIKIDTASNGQIDTLIFNFDSNSMDISKWEEMLKNLDINIDLGNEQFLMQMDFNDSLTNFDFNFEPNGNPFELDFFGQGDFPFGESMMQQQDNSAKIGITPSKSYKGNGVMIESVTPASLAAALGLQTGDILVELNGNKIQKFTDLKSILEQHQVGDEAQITFTREGKKKKMTGFFIPVSNMNIQRDIRISRP